MNCTACEWHESDVLDDPELLSRSASDWMSELPMSSSSNELVPDPFVVEFRTSHCANAPYS
jgi:hypothetical protein